MKIRGTAQHVAEKYSQLARDAQAGGDPVAAENYLQHAEHYFRIIAASQEQMRQQYGQYHRSSDDEDDGDGDESGNGFSYDNGEQPVIDDADFGSQPQPHYESNHEPRREHRPQRNDRRGRYGRNDRSSHNEQPRLEADHEEQERNERPERSFAPSRERVSHQEQQAERIERPSRGRTPRPVVVTKEESAPSLPAFLTTPVRQPAPEKVEPSETLFGDTPENEETPKPIRRRRRTVRAADETKAAVDDI